MTAKELEPCKKCAWNTKKWAGGCHAFIVYIKGCTNCTTIKQRSEIELQMAKYKEYVENAYKERGI